MSFTGLLRSIATLALLSLLAFLAGFLWFLFHAGAEAAGPPRRTDGIAVLTGGADRVETGLRLLRDGQAERLLISGVHPGATLAELDLPLDFDRRALAPRITLGRKATSTRGNAEEVAAWAQDYRLRSIRVVTAGYHMPRALLELRRALPQAELVPHPVVPARLRGNDAVAKLRTWSLLVREYGKLLYAASAGLRDALALAEARLAAR